MKYRFRPSDKPHPSQAPSLRPRTFRLRGVRQLRRLSANAESIHLFSLFEERMLPPAAKQPKGSFFAWLRQRIATGTAVLRQRLLPLFRTLLRRIGAGIRRVMLAAEKGAQQLAMRRHRTKKEPTIHAVPIFAGFLCAALAVSALSAGGILLGLFARYRRPYRAVTIPDFVGQEPLAVTEQDGITWNFTIQYEQNPTVEAGRVIAQSPHPGAVRRLYGRQNEYPVVLTVSQGENSYVLENLVGMRERDALLVLDNRGIHAAVTRLYSETAPQGTVLQLLPHAGTRLSEGDTVSLQISMGSQTDTVSVPLLIGMTETAAATLLKVNGLVTGQVSYRASSHAPGTVIAQQTDADCTVPSGTAVSYTVSTGDRYFVTSIPDVYGMTEADAAARLRQYGLVVGRRIAVANDAPSGRILMQDPPAGTPMTAATYSVTLYISS